MIDRRSFVSGLAALGVSGCTHLVGQRRAPSVIVVGAGMAGATAARRLHEAGCRVTVVEARDRVGGRIWSVRDGASATLELGASWIHGHVANPLVALAAAAKVTTTPTDDDSYPAMYERGGAPIPHARQEPLYAALKELRACLRARRDALRDESPDAPLSDAIAAELEALGRSRSLDGAALAGVRHLVATEIEGAYAESTSRLSLRHWGRGSWFEGADLLVHGGYDRLVETLLVGLDVRLGSEVVAIRHGTEGIRVRLRSGAALEAEQAVVTLPLGVLKAGDVAFTPPLPERKRAAIVRLGVGIFDKLYLRFPRRFWPAEPSWLQYAGAVPDEWPMFFNLARYGGAPVLAAFHTGDAARRLAMKSDAEVVAEATKVLATIGRHERWRVEAPVAVHRTRWGMDSWAKGSYSHVPPAADVADFDEVGASVDGRLHFAGEATSAHHFMTVHAACLSGERAAAAVTG